MFSGLGFCVFKLKEESIVHILSKHKTKEAAYRAVDFIVYL